MTITTDELAAQQSAVSSGPVWARSFSVREGVLRRLLTSQLAGIILALVVWEFVPRAGLVPQRYIPPFTTVLPEFVAALGRGEFWVAAGNTLSAWAVGLSIGLVVGVLLGVVIGASAAAYRATRFVLEFFRPIPSVALIPLAILVFGTTLDMKVFLIVFATFWPILVQSIYGVQEVDPVTRDSARTFGFTRRDIFLRITLPSAAPFIATGMRLASALAIVLAITAELVAGAPGLGRAILIAQNAGAYDLMYALTVATGLISLLLSAAIARTERRLLRWHPSHREVKS